MDFNSGNKTIFDVKDYASLFKWPEYCVFAAVLVLSMGIGIFYGFFNNKNRTNEEFLMASRSMSVFPVTLSLICSFVSAITIMGTCVEVFYYGFVYFFFAISFLPMTLAVAYLYLPVFFNLQLTSAYEYFELRFGRRIRLIISISAIVHLLIYMGGLKAVLWTDALQAIIMVGSIITVIIAGSSQIGGFGVVWDRAKAGGRLELWNFDVDPRTRHTLWTGLFAAYFSWIPLFAGAQAQIQRYLAVPSMEKAKQCLLFNMLGLLCIVFICCVLGLVIYANYYDCDPNSVGGVTSTDQILPLFVMDTLGTFSGMPGLMVAGLTCGSLSSVSSALNALPAIIVEDYIKPYKPGLSDVRLGYLSKIISLVGGIISFCLIFVIALIGNVLPFASLLHGTFLGPVCALFTLGMLFPWANGIGSILGAICSLVLTLFIGIGSIIEGNAGHLSNQKLSLRTDGCYANETETYVDAEPLISSPFSKLILSAENDITVNDVSPMSSKDWKDVEYSALHNLFGISYLWLPAVTVVSAIVFGLIFSLIVNKWKKAELVKPKYLTPVILSMWIKLLGEDFMRDWVEFDGLEISNSNSAPYLNSSEKDLISGSISTIQLNVEYSQDHRFKKKEGELGDSINPVNGIDHDVPNKPE